MFKNYYYLARCTDELKPLLLNADVYEIFSQEKEILNLHIGDHNFPDRHLFMSTNQNFPYILVKDEHHKAKKNFINFWQNYLPSKILSIDIAEDERVIRFKLESIILFFVIRGNLTNVYASAGGNSIQSFKQSKNIRSDFEHDLTNMKFIDPENIPNITDVPVNCNEYREFKKYFPALGRYIFDEIKYRDKFHDSKILLQSINSIINEILKNKISIRLENTSNKAFFIPSSFNSVHSVIQKEYLTFNEALKNFISLHYQFKKKNQIKVELEKYFNKELAGLAEKLNRLKNRIEKDSMEKEYQMQGNLLLSNIDKLRKGVEYIEVKDYNTDSIVKIKLKKNYFPKQNIDYYFNKAKEERISYLKSKELYNIALDKYEVLMKDKHKFEIDNSIENYLSLKEKLKPQKVKEINKKLKYNIKYRHYILEGKYHIYIGRDSKSNDLLSTKFAKQNDYWFHARGLPGSHVILRSDTPKQPLPKPVLKKCASVAAFYSKAKTAATAPVSYTLAKFVYKKKGMEPGQVLLAKEKVLLVTPVIPRDCELIND